MIVVNLVDFGLKYLVCLHPIASRTFRELLKFWEDEICFGKPIVKADVLESLKNLIDTRHLHYIVGDMIL